MHSKKILFVVHSLGLGHASRTLSIIRYYLKKGYKLDIISYNHAMTFLKEELVDYKSKIKYISFYDYPPLERGKGLLFYLYIVVDTFNTNKIILKERRYIKNKTEYEFILSDGRYGFASKKIPSFLVSHQVSFIMPNGLEIFKPLSDYFNYLNFKRFDSVLIPDYESKTNSLAVKLSHNFYLKKLPHNFVGILSSYKKLNIKKDIDYLIIISGYLFEHRDEFINKLLNQFKKIKGKKVFVIGDVSKKYHKKLPNNIEVYSYVSSKLKVELYNRAKYIVSRSGYTTIMDLVELEKKALLFPTPHQGEQKYLADIYKDRNYFLTSDSQKKFDLKELFENDTQYIDYSQYSKVKDNLKKIDSIISSFTNKQFFSIIIPAHNEEKYITKTLNYLNKLNYPKNKFEIIVVENGSSDSTYTVVKNLKSKIKNLQLFKSDKGVSIARNYGKRKISKDSDWIIYLDADTILKPNFLDSFNIYLNKNKSKNYVVGTTQITPDKKTKLARFWFNIYDLGHKLLKTSYSLQFVRSDIARIVNYDESLSVGEDQKYIKDCLKYGEFLFFRTKDVCTSVRRFENDGYFKLFMVWNLNSILPLKYKEKINYKVVR